METIEQNSALNMKDWQELKELVHTEYTRRSETKRGDFGIYSKLLIIVTGIATSYIGILAITPSLSWLLLWGMLGLATFLLIVNGAHDASHSALFRSKTANKAFLAFSFNLFGIDGLLWGLRHITAHHPHTNVSAVDPDSLPNSYLRFSPHHPWRAWFRFQHLYAIFFYGLAFLHTAVVQDFDHVINKPLPYVKRLSSTALTLLRILAVKAAYLTVFLIIPVVCCEIPMLWALLGIAVQMVVASLVFVLTIALNHYVLETTFYRDDTQRSENNFLMHQLSACADWNATSRFWGRIMGGANAHTAHHLFPYFSHRHYYWISKIIKEFCEERALPYNNFSFFAGLSSHFRFLYRLGLRP